LTIVTLFWASTSYGTAFSHKFITIALMRVFLGLFSAFSSPVSYSLISDYFPPQRRTLANAFFSGSSILGISLSSASIVLISDFGWRRTFIIVATYGVLCGLLVLFLVKEPVRGRFEPVTIQVEEK
jgi:MFS family permease